MHRSISGSATVSSSVVVILTPRWPYLSLPLEFGRGGAFEDGVELVDLGEGEDVGDVEDVGGVAGADEGDVGRVLRGFRQQRAVWI